MVNSPLISLTECLIFPTSNFQELYSRCQIINIYKYIPFTFINYKRKGLMKLVSDKIKGLLYFYRILP